MDENAWYFPRTHLAQSVLRACGPGLVLVAERGKGKTSFLCQDLAPLASERGYLPVYLDLWRARHAPEAGIAEQLRKASETLEMSLGAHSNGSESERFAHPAAPVQYWAARIVRAAGRRKVLLMIDEIQLLAGEERGIKVAAALSTVLEQHDGRIDFLFTGTRGDRLSTLFHASRAPLHKFSDSMELPDLGDAFIDHLIRQFCAKSRGMILDRARLLSLFKAPGSRPGEVVSLLRAMLRKRDYDLPNGAQRARTGVPEAISSARPCAVRGSAGRALENRLLGALPSVDWQRLERHFSGIEVAGGQSLFEPNSLLDYAYFPATSIVSLQHLSADGTSTKVAAVGPEGVVGVTAVMAGGMMNHQAIVQSKGRLYRVKSAILKEEFARGGALHELLLRYTQALLAHISQMAVCNRRHTIDQQVCSWMLGSLDGMNSQELTMTHELLANTLGVRREGITEAAHKLQRAGLISYRRGHIRVINRMGLEARCCECYGIVRREYDRLFPGLHRCTVHTSPALAAASQSDARRNDRAGTLQAPR